MTTIDLNKALEIAKTTTTTRRGGGNKKLGEISQAIVDLLAMSEQALHCHQIAAGLNAAGLEVTPKQIADKCWMLAGGKENNGVLVKLGNGEYAIRNKE